MKGEGKDGNGEDELTEPRFVPACSHGQEVTLHVDGRIRVHGRQSRGDDVAGPSHDFGAIGHHGYARVVRELGALQRRLRGGTKFECLTRYRCANLFFLVMPNELYREAELPLGWGALVELGGALDVRRKPAWHDNSSESRLRFLHRIATAGTRHLNRQLEISFELVQAERQRAL